MIKTQTPQGDLKDLFINAREQEIGHSDSEIDYQFERTRDIDWWDFLEEEKKEYFKKAYKNYQAASQIELEEQHFQNNSDEEMKSGDSIPYINEQDLTALSNMNSSPDD